MNVLFAASECAPFCKTGGLADVLGDLPKELLPFLPGKKKSKVVVFLPKYAAVDGAKFHLEKVPGTLRIPIADRVEAGQIWRHQGEVQTYFIENKKYFDRPGIYGELGKDYHDNDERFAFFCRAVLETCKQINFVPDILHGHDWQTGLLPAYLKTLYSTDAFFAGTGSVFTIHNMAYQGNFPRQSLPVTGLGWNTFTPDKLEYYDQVSFLKAGLTYSDRLSTVSPRYAREIQSGNLYGRGMEGILKLRGKRLAGILNGLDENLWNPSKDPRIAARFSVKETNFPDKKKACKKELQKTAGLTSDPATLLIGMVSRLDPQKGFKVILKVLPKIILENPKVQCVILGSGDPTIEKSLSALARRFRRNFSFNSGFNDPLAHKIYAGSDLFLMPSEFEPCGLGQMIAMRYGTIPVATPTGGLYDTVKSWNPKSRAGNGFMCRNISSPALAEALRKAFKAYEDPAQWKVLAKNAMLSDFSWKKSASQYVRLYAETLKELKSHE